MIDMIKPTATLLNDYIVVEFEEPPKLNESLDIVAPERFLIQEADQEGEHNAWGVTTDRRTINPQVVKVIQGDKNIPDGEKCFVHYGAFEVAQWLNDKQALIKSAMAFFMVEPIRAFEGNYIGEEVFIEGEKTESGIYLTPYSEAKLPCNILIKHAPESGKFKNGDEVITVDAAQYTLKYQDRKLVKLKESEIIAYVDEYKQTHPNGKYLIVRYVEDIPKEIEAENAYKAHTKDVAIKYRLYVPGIDFTPTQPSKHVKAEIVAIGEDIIVGKHLDAGIGDIVLVNRHRGVMLSNETWVINLDTILLSYV